MVILDISLKAHMNARLVGSGENTVVLAHGFGGDQSVWDKILPHLAQNQQVLLFDWSFSSASTNGKDPNSTLFDPVRHTSFDAFADDLIDLLHEMKLGSSSVVFIGHSMSAMIGCLASIKRPLLFSKLVLIGGSPCYLNQEGYEGGLDKAQIEQILTDIESNFQEWSTGFASIAMGAKDLISVEKFRKSLSGMKPDNALSVAKTIFCSDNRDILTKVQVPCTIIQPSNDIFVPNSVAYYMQKKMINTTSTVEMIEADGHFPHLTQTKLLLEILDRVLPNAAATTTTTTSSCTDEEHHGKELQEGKIGEK